MSYSELPDADRINRTADAVRARGINVEVIETKEAALAKVQSLIPDGATVMTAGSVTLQQIGLEAILKEGKHPWRNLKAEILAEKDPAKQSVLRKQATLSQFYLGSVHAIAETGEIVVASGGGSQIAPYAFSSPNVIWVAGTQKIVPSLDDAFRRVREYSHPMEDKRMKSIGVSAGSIIGKLLVIEREAAYLKRNVMLILVDEVLGY